MSAAGIRTYSIIKSLLSNPQSELLYVSPQSTSDVYSKRLKEYFPNTNTLTIQPNDTSSFTNNLKHFQPNLCFFDTFIAEEMFGWQIFKNFPNCLRVCDTQDLRFLRKFRHYLVKKNPNMPLKEIVNLIPNAIDDWPERNLLFRELSSLHRCDLNLIVSPDEIQLLVDKYSFPSNKLFLAPFYFPINGNRIIKPYKERNNFVMIGNFTHDPNVDAVEWMKMELWPKIREKLPNVEIHIYGALANHKHLSMTNKKEGFLVLGELDNLEKLGDYKVQLAPLRFGAGIKGKIADGWFYGLPTVTTPIGSEGMLDEKGDWGGRIAYNGNEFIEKAIELYSNEQIWKETQECGFRILNNIFNENDLKLLKEKVDDFYSNLKEKRKWDIMQHLFWETNMRATEYMSKFIEIKKLLKK